jgi:hypothetical protein
LNIALAHVLAKRDGVVHWHIVDLRQWLYEEFQVCVAKLTLSRELRVMGYRNLSARSRHHAQAEGAIEDCRKPFSPVWPKAKVSTQPI